MSDTRIPLNICVDVNTPAGKAWVDVMGGPYWTPTPYVDLNDGLSERASVHYTSTQPFGRTEAYKTFTGVGNREVSLRLHYMAGESDNATGTTDLATIIRETVVNPALWLEGLKYPTDHQPPPPVFLVVGNLLGMRAIVTDCTVHWQGPWHQSAGIAQNAVSSVITSGGDLLPHGCIVSLTFTSVANEVGGAVNPRGDGFSGISTKRSGFGGR